MEETETETETETGLLVVVSCIPVSVSCSCIAEEMFPPSKRNLAESRRRSMRIDASFLSLPNFWMDSHHPTENSVMQRKAHFFVLKSKVQEVMSFPAITLPPSKTVLDAAALMLKNKIHRIPIVNESGQVIGMVTRTDIFQALENQSA